MRLMDWTIRQVVYETAETTEAFQTCWSVNLTLSHGPEAYSIDI